MFHGRATPFPVVYSDGGKEINLGIIMIDPSMSFKSLLFLLSQKIGISPHQFSVFLADQNTNQKIPLTANVNLSAFLQTGAYYLFVKRFKKSPAKDNKNLMRKFTLLRRNNVAVDGIPFYSLEPVLPSAPPIPDRVEFERDAFLRSLEMNAESLRRGTPNGDGGPVCEECLKAKLTGIDAEFHLCVHDEVVVGFRSLAGPISRPAKNSSDKGH